jgi:hypothetical protein
MKFYRDNWYYTGGLLFVGLAFFLGFFGHRMIPIQRVLTLSFMSLMVHQFEEYAIPGGFPAVWNMAVIGEKESPDRYPLNRLTCVCVNTFAAYPFYILSIIFYKAIWLGLGNILFGGLAQFVVHGIFINRKLKTFYNPGLGAVIFLHWPVAFFYLRYIYEDKLVQPIDWLWGILCMAAASVLIVYVPVSLLKNRQSRYPFSKEEMERFHVKEKLIVIGR